MESLEAFAERIQARLMEASFADKQAILQLVIERIIVGEDTLEIRHVVPLRSPVPDPGGHPPPGIPLCSDGVDNAQLHLCFRIHRLDRFGKTFWVNNRELPPVMRRK